MLRGCRLIILFFQSRESSWLLEEGECKCSELSLCPWIVHGLLDILGSCGRVLLAFSGPGGASAVSPATGALSCFIAYSIREGNHHQIPSSQWLSKEKQQQLVRNFMLWTCRKCAFDIKISRGFWQGNTLLKGVLDPEWGWTFSPYQHEAWGSTTNLQKHNSRTP